MKVLILNNDLRVYWKRRITYLHKYLAEHNIKFYAVELFGKGSPYAFDPYDSKENWWSCLFPENDFSELSKSVIAQKIYDKLNDIKPDIIIGGSIVFFSGAIGLRWAIQHKKKFVMFDDGKPSDIKRNKLVQFVKDTLIKQADALWLPSTDYDAEYPYIDDDTVIFHGFNCIDNDQFKFEEKKTVDAKTIICVARLVPIKNMDNLLRAWKIVEDSRSDYKLNIIGNGPLADTLTQLASTLNLKSVTFVGTVNNNDLPLHLYNADAFVLASYSESWGLVVNEAMAAGLPVLLSNKINAAQALLQEGVNGYSFNPNNVNDIADKLLKFIALDDVAKQDMTANSLKIINTMSYQNMGQELLAAINKLNTKKFKKPGVVANTIIKMWNGNYNTSGWDKL